MITGKAHEPVTKGEFYWGMVSVFAGLFAVHSAADAGTLLRVIISLLITGGIIVYGVAARRAHRLARDS